jgi:hypothetical protein
MSDHRARSFDEISRSLKDFEASDNMLLSPSLMRPHANNWVAVHGTRIAAVASTLSDVRDQLRREGIPLTEVAIRFIEKDGLATA